MKRLTQGEAFCEGRLLEIVLPPGGGGFMAVLEAYFDESEREEGRGVFAVAGLAFPKSKVKKLNKEWRTLFAPYGGSCHMADLNARERQFKGIDADEVHRLLVGAIEIIDRHSSFGSAVGCYLPEMNTVLPTHLPGFEHAYVFLAHMAMTELGTLVGSRRPDAKIAYMFEKGHCYDEHAHRFVAGADAERMASYRHYSNAWVPKVDTPALQAADVFVWEYAKYWQDTVIDGKRQMRKSLIEILSSRRQTIEFQRRYKVGFYTGTPLWSAMAKFQWYLEGQMAEHVSS